MAIHVEFYKHAHFNVNVTARLYFTHLQSKRQNYLALNRTSDVYLSLGFPPPPETANTFILEYRQLPICARVAFWVIAHVGHSTAKNGTCVGGQACSKYAQTRSCL